MWIEIPKDQTYYPGHKVAPFAGVWIEITTGIVDAIAVGVAPFAGVWIEIYTIPAQEEIRLGRTLRGCVD